MEINGIDDFRQYLLAGRSELKKIHYKKRKKKCHETANALKHTKKRL